jgi:DNA-binding transcriptional MerR regulator
VYSIGELSAAVGVKIPTIRYYEKIKLMSQPARSQGNQRQYSQAALERLVFIKHARELGFSLKSIRSLMTLSQSKQGDCSEINRLAEDHLSQVRMKLNLLEKLESELVRMTIGCQSGQVEQCYVIESLNNHEHCQESHSF